ncbi:MAG: L,D-transpeptidase family protein [Pseudomonadales bacterium]|jgi:murein L,D-transpeptidase YcbB/YkuD|nr:L,D-transpeptidase family protein [Pseudomonadales bacterium]
MRPRARGLATLAVLLCILGLPAPLSASPTDTIAAWAERWLETGADAIDGVRPLHPDALARVYGSRRHAPAWGPARRAAPVLRLLADSAGHGLTPDDFHASALLRLRAARLTHPDDPRLLGWFDLLLTDGVMTYARQLRRGKVDQVSLQPRWRDGDAPGEDEALLDALLASTDPAALLEAIAPAGRSYRALRSALADARRQVEAGGWPSVGAPGRLRPGDTGAGVAAVRARLAREDPRLTETEDPAHFDGPLEAAVTRFQARHGLAPDGIVGPATLRALQVSADARVDQLRVNLERERWVREDEDRGGLQVVVNIAAFDVSVLRGGRTQFHTRAIVGSAYRQTPVFASAIEYLVLNPVWNVPPGIAEEELLPKLRADPDWLRRNDMIALDGAGRSLGPTEAARAAERPGETGLRLIQRAGADNPLGRIKFMFPNRYAVYLHDTPQRRLFERASRTFSHGCVRVDRPVELAAVLLGAGPGQTAGALAERIASGVTETIYLPEAIPIRVRYATAVAETDGSVSLLEDSYGRDAPLLRALNASFGGATSARSAAGGQ